MEDLIHAVLLGIVQGATEFLPVSSSGHLKLGEALLGTSEPDLLFDIVLHVGSLVAVCLIYRQTLIDAVKGLFEGLKKLVGGEGLGAALEPEGAKLTVWVVAATVATTIFGLSIGAFLEGPLSTVGAVGVALIINGAILLGSHWAQQRGEEVEAKEGRNLWGLTFRGALLVGLIQGIAVVPGLSRSGLTITTCLLLGVEREQAARFSFVLSIPAILGALVLKFDPTLFTASDPDRLIRYGAGAAAACVVGAVCLVLLIKLLKQARFHHFAWYCFAAGALALVWSAMTP